MKILIADDDKTARVALDVTVKDMGHETFLCSDGTGAWEYLQNERVDVAILDWVMPGISGIELCKKIRQCSNTQEKYLYIILLTAKDSKEDIIRALHEGADDYITKPFDKTELKSRLDVGIRTVGFAGKLALSNLELKKYNQQMTQLVEQRSNQLIHAERMATLGLLSAGIAHEINNPTAFIAGNTQTLEKFLCDLKPIINSKITQNDTDYDKLNFILEEVPRIIESINNGVNRITKIVKGLKAYCRDDKGQSKDYDINESVEKSLELCNNALKYNINVHKRLARNLPFINADSQQIDQVLVNLFINAADAMEDTQNAVLSIETGLKDNSVFVTVSDTGPGIDPDKIDDIFKPFFTTKSVDKGTGLGLYTVRGIIENHSGSIQVSNGQAGGAVFTIKLPLAGRTAQ